MSLEIVLIAGSRVAVRYDARRVSDRVISAQTLFELLLEDRDVAVGVAENP